MPLHIMKRLCEVGWDAISYNGSVKSLKSILKDFGFHVEKRQLVIIRLQLKNMGSKRILYLNLDIAMKRTDLLLFWKSYIL
jgi:hypothetical protein